jgi:chlorophyll synthase
MILALALDVWAGQEGFTVSAIAFFGYCMSNIYSAPPLKLKQNGWFGDLAILAFAIFLCPGGVDEASLAQWISVCALLC